jgi:PiT family inorganic phosphate transporter
VVKAPALYKAPQGNKPPPIWIRGLLVLTCTGVSFAHGSNDGQKGMGLIMLILIGTVPTAYALNSTMHGSQVESFHTVSVQMDGVLGRLSAGVPTPNDPRDTVMATVERRALQPATIPALQSLIATINQQVASHDTLTEVPQGEVTNIRNEMYLTDEGLRLLQKTPPAGMSDADKGVVAQYRRLIADATKFIPSWVKVVVALALGLGTMVGWKRIVVTVGEKIGKDHLTYAQGASAELVAMMTIGAADMYGLPVSTTHVLTSGVAGTMAANGSGLQWSTVRSLALAWVLTLPASIILAGALFWLFRLIF